MAASRSSFRDIKDEMARRIASRVWPPGTIIPGEEDLAREFGSARATVNRALQELARSGIVERRRKAGTRVAMHPVREARFVIPLVRQEIEAEGAAYHYALLSRELEPASDLVRAKLALPGPLDMLHVRCLHMAGSTPWQFEDRWINVAAAPEAGRETFRDIGPNEWLVRNAPFSRAEFVFRAARATPEESRLLRTPDGEAVFIGERMTWLGEQPVTFVRMVHPSSHAIRTSV